MDKFLYFIIHFFRRLLYFLTRFVLCTACGIIFIVTYEPFTWKKVTKRKIRRIRALTKFKLWLWRNFRWYFEFIHDAKYLEELEKRFGNKKQ